MTEVVIELDRYGEPAEQEPPRRRWAAWGIGPWLAACSVVVCLLTLAAAGGEPQPVLRHVADLQVPVVAELVSAGNRLLVSDSSGLTSLDPLTGAVRWRAVPRLQRPYVRAEGDLLILTGSEEGQSASPATTMTIAVDAQTGEVRWRIAGALETVGDLLIVHRTDDSGPLPVAELAAYDLAGRQIWSHLAVAPRRAIDRRRGVAITLDPATGELVEYRLADGTVSARRTEQALVGAAEIFVAGEIVHVTFTDGSVVMRRENRFIPSEQLNMPEIYANARLERTDCGQVWCEHSAFQSGIRLVEKASGTEMHYSEQWELVVHTDFGLVGTGVAVSATRRNRIEFFDPATGRKQELPEGWTWLGVEFTDRIIHRPGPMIFLNPTGNGTYLALLDAKGLRVVGFVPRHYLSQCMAEGYTLACRLEPETLRLWRLGP